MCRIRLSHASSTDMSKILDLLVLSDRVQQMLQIQGGPAGESRQGDDRHEKDSSALSVTGIEADGRNCFVFV